jgi:FPC/CPF motif-containing protein YcgG
MEHFIPTDRLYKPVNGILKSYGTATFLSEDKLQAFQKELRETVMQPNYPCVAAIKSYAKDDYQVGFYGRLGADGFARDLRNDLLYFLREQRATGSTYLSFWAVFDEADYSEEDFENRLWKQLSNLTSAELRETDWGPNTNSNPQDPSFRFSLAGAEFFVVGLHPQSSRISRQFSRPVLIFNVWDQFAELMRIGQYEPMIQTNRKRDQKFQGDANPMAVAHGDDWESIQFSGRNNSKQWKCPFSFLKGLVT